LGGGIDERNDTFAGTDRARDQGDDGRDQADDGRDQAREPFVGKPGHQYARNYPDPLTGHPLQVYPSRGPSEFESMEDFWKYKDAVSRWNNCLPPPRPKPDGEAIRPAVPTPSSPGRRERSRYQSHHVGIRLRDGDFELLLELARAHAVPPGTMARILVVRGVRAAAEVAKD
jgi:hypothetical protein